MCNLSWGIYQDGQENKAKEIAMRLYQDGMPLEKITRIVSESLSKVQEWLSEASAASEPAAEPTSDPV